VLNTYRYPSLVGVFLHTYHINCRDYQVDVRSIVQNNIIEKVFINFNFSVYLILLHHGLMINIWLLNNSRFDMGNVYIIFMSVSGLKQTMSTPKVHNRDGKLVQLRVL
jgi:hypothetical protein